MSDSQEIQWLLEEKYNGEKTADFFTDCELLKKGTPLAYLIGSVPFLDCTIFLDNHPLIPRTETEYWTEKAIKKINSINGKSLRVLDLCAGSGAIGVAVATAVTAAQVDFAEIDPSLISTIHKNLLHNTSINNKEKYNVQESDLFSAVTDSYNLILSNPPYIDPVLDRTQKSVKNHEPHQALYGGTDGMELIERIILQAPQHLLPQGQLWLEHEPEQSASINTLGQQSGFTVTTHTDQYDTERYSILVLK